MKEAKLFVVPTFLLVYIASVIFARNSWGGLFGKLTVSVFDLKPNQEWLLPVIINLLAAFVGTPQLVAHMLALRRPQTLSIARRIAFFFCLGTVTWCLWGAIAMAFYQHKALLAGLKEFQKGTLDEIFAAGKISDNCYSNAIIGVAIEVPTNWYPASLNSIYRAKEAGTRSAFGNTEAAKQMVPMREGVYPLFVFRRYPEDFRGFSPSLNLIAYDKRITAQRTLSDYANTFANVSGPYRAATNPRHQTIGQSTGYYIRIEGRLSKGTIQQDVYVTETQAFYLVMVASALDEDDFTPSKAAVSTLRIWK